MKDTKMIEKLKVCMLEKEKTKFIEEIKVKNNIGKIITIYPPERKRIYHFPNGDRILNNVCELIIKPSGIHNLKTVDGKYHIIPTGWIEIEIELDIDGWTL